MPIAERMKKIHPSMTLAINNRAREMRALGIDVISLAVGEPDFNTPGYIKDAAIKAIEDNFTRYTAVAGIPPLRAAAAAFFQCHYQTEIPPEWIIFGAGGKQCLYSLIQVMINPEDEVLIPSPYWVSYPDMVLLAGGKPVFVPADLKAGFKASPEGLEAALTDKTKALIINSPNNPTGAVYSEKELADIISWALARNIFVISDEIYDQLVFPPARPASAAGWLKRRPELLAVVNGLSKSYAMTGWRVGFLASNPEIIREMAVLQSHSLSNVCSIAQKAALAALEGPDDFVDDMRRAFAKRRNMAVETVRGWKKAVCPSPDGAFYIFPDLSAYYNDKIKNSIDMCSYLLEEAHVAAVPGAAFGNDSCIRISYAVADAVLEKALNAIGGALARLEPDHN